MRINALGPVEALSAGTEASLGGPKPKALLAALVLEPRQIISINRLVDLIWDDRPPRSAVALVHTYVSALRRGFAALGTASVLDTRAPGYVLRIDAADVDVEVFARRLADARRAEQDLDHTSAAEHYRAALELWRGPAFGGVDARFARTQAALLEGDRLAAQEGLARSVLALGRLEEATSLLTVLTEAHPHREESRALLMRALYLGGRQAEALATYRDGRDRLIADLGVEPGTGLRELHAQILVDSVPVPSHPLDRRAPRSVGPRRAPNQLPPDIADFSGRDEDVARLLAIARSRTTTTTVVVSAVGGAGKSALAVHCAHLLTAEYPDGQLFADLQGTAAPVGAAEVLGRFLRALGVASIELPDRLDERAELYRMRVANRRLIVVLDNVRGAHQVRPLVPGAGQCLVIITSRSRLAGLAGCDLVELDLLSAERSMRMLTRIVGAARIASDPAAGATIAALCGGLPLAIRIAGAKLLTRPHWPLKALAARLSDERRRLDELTVGDLAIRSSLGLSYGGLDDAQRTAFHLLALLGLLDFGSWLAAPLLDIPLPDAEDVVEQLVELRLLEVTGIDALGRVRHRLHELVRLFGAEQAARHEPPEVTTAAIARALAVWTVLTETGAARLPRVTIGLRPTPTSTAAVDPRLVAEVAAAPIEWLAAETVSLVRVIERAHELGVDEPTTTLIASLLSSPFAARNEFDGWQRTHELALAAARRAGNPLAEATLLAGLGQLYYEKDDFAAARDHFRQAGDQAAAIGDENVQAVALVGVGTVARDLGHFDAAAADLAMAVELSARTGNRDVLAAARYGLGAIHRDHGDLDAATAMLTECVELYRAAGDARGEALSLRGLSLCRRAAGEHDAAADLSNAAHQILERAGDVLGTAYTRQSLAKADLRRGRHTGVRESLDACLSVCERHKDRFGIALVTRTMGEFALAAGDLAEARALLSDALDQWTALALPLWQARTSRDLAAAISAADPAAAGRLWERAVAQFRAAGSREAAELAATDPRTWLVQVRRAGL